jgi:hypothetical protein
LKSEEPESEESEFVSAARAVRGEEPPRIETPAAIVCGSNPPIPVEEAG